MNRPTISKKAIAFLFFATVLFIFFFPAFFQNRTFFAFDTLLPHPPWSSLLKDFQPHNTLITDPIHAFYFSLFYPAHFYFQQSIASGTLNWWFDLNFCGVPFSYYSHPAFYLFYTFFPLTTAHDLLLFFSLLGTGLMTFLYLDKIGLRSLPALVGSVAWTFNGYVMVWLEYEHIPLMACSLPATLYCIEWWWEKRSALPFLCIVCSVASGIGANLAHVLIYQSIFVGCYLLFRYFIEYRRESRALRRHFRPFLIAILAVIAGFAISANFFTTHIMVFKESQRQPFAFEELYKKTGQLPSKYLITLMMPDFFGSPAGEISFTPGDHSSQPYNNYNELCIYSGVMTLFLALACIPFIRKNRYIGFFLPAAAVSLLMAMGSILYYPLATWIPGLNISTPTRILYIFGFSVSILSALGAQRIMSETMDGKPRFAIMTMWCLLLAAFCVAVFIVQSEQGLKWAASSVEWEDPKQPVDAALSLLRLHFSLLSRVIVKPLLIMITSFSLLSSIIFSSNQTRKKTVLLLGLLLLTYDLVSFGRHYNTASPKDLEYPSTPAMRFLQEDRSKFRLMTFGDFLHHTFVPYGIEDLAGYGSFYPRRYGEFLFLSQYGPDKPVPQNLSRWIMFRRFGSPLLDLLNTKYVVVPPNAETNYDQLTRVYNGEVTIFKNRNVFPRIFFVRDFVHAQNAVHAFELLGKFSRDDFREKVILESPPPDGWTRGKTPPSREHRERIDTVSYEPNKIEFNIMSETRGFVVIGDNYHPDWTAVIDGNPAPVLRANYIMRAVPVGPGRHTVTLVFKPRLIQAGLVVTIAGWAVLLGLIGLYWVKQTLSAGRDNSKSPH